MNGVRPTRLRRRPRPFRNGDDWFELEFAFFQSRTAEHLDEDMTSLSTRRMDRPRQNGRGCAGSRASGFSAVGTSGDVNTRDMHEQAPFVYREAVR